MSSMLAEHLFVEIQKLVESKRGWRHLLEYSSTLEVECKKKILWSWPSVENLMNIEKLFKEVNILRILSIGCGNGFLEWLIKDSLGVEIYGLEIDRNWWQSKYTIKSFIILNYADDMLVLKQTKAKEKFLQNCCSVTNWTFALLFCYFNNQQAFLNYVELYQGDWIIIIGPNSKLETFTYTEPMPLQPNFLEDSDKKWQLKRTLCMGEHDILALYKKN